MENASKALLMAAGVFLVMLILALVIFAWGKFSDYQNAKDSLVDIEDTAKFNEQFTHYNRDDVQGYEILSLVNKVIDYNKRRADVEGAQNSEKSNPITLVVILGNKKTEFAYDGTNLLITENEYKISGVGNSFGSIISDGTIIESTYGTNISQISKLISSFFSDEVKNDENKKANAVKKFNSLSKTKVTNYNELLGYKNDIYKYYEYMQFKKGVFNCENLTYDNSTGRVNNMKFTFSGKIY